MDAEGRLVRYGISTSTYRVTLAFPGHHWALVFLASVGNAGVSRVKVDKPLPNEGSTRRGPVARKTSSHPSHPTADAAGEGGGQPGLLSRLERRPGQPLSGSATPLAP